MTSRRTSKVAQSILETVSSAILFGLKDPRVKNVTVLHVEVSGDLQQAKIYISVLGDEKVQSLCMHGLNSARGFLQSKIADRLKTRYTPILKFVLDESVKHSVETTRILKDLLPGDQSEQDNLGKDDLEADADVLDHEVQADVQDETAEDWSENSLDEQDVGPPAE